MAQRMVGEAINGSFLAQMQYGANDPDLALAPDIAGSKQMTGFVENFQGSPR